MFKTNLAEMKICPYFSLLCLKMNFVTFWKELTPDQEKTLE